MSNKTKRFILPEEEIPHYWYNIQADMVNKPMPPLNPATKQPLKPEDMYPIFAEELCRQELNQTDAWIEIPEEVREMYKYYRCTPLVRAYGLEKALDTPAHIYFKNESVSPMGSHKLNSAIPQAYYCKKEGVTNVTTETGAGQWGASLAYAARLFGLEAAVYQVKISYEQKPYRRSIMHTFGAQVTASPSMSTRAGKDILTANPNYQGSLGTAISEAIELARTTPNCKYTLGSVLSHVTLHQTIIGLEAEKQMAMAGEYPDMVIACFGGPRREKDPFHRRRTGLLPQTDTRQVPVRLWRRSRIHPAAAHVHTGTQLRPGQHTCRRFALPRCRRHRIATAERRTDGSCGHPATGILRCRRIVCTGRRHHPGSRVVPRHCRHHPRSQQVQGNRRRKGNPVQPLRTRTYRHGLVRQISGRRPHQLRTH